MSQGPDLLTHLTLDDWLNPPFTPDPRDEAGRPTNGDFRFCYLGPAGTFTPLHRDVYASYSWSANVVGRKLWWFFPPDRLGPVKDKHGELVFDVRDLDGEGGGIKVLQEVRRQSKVDWSCTRLMAGRRSDLRTKWLAPSGTEPRLCELSYQTAIWISPEPLSERT